MIETTVRDGRRLIRMADGENRLNLEFVTELDEALRASEADPLPLVLTGDGKFFSNGLDLDWMGASDPSEVTDFFDRLHTVLGAPFVLRAAQPRETRPTASRARPTPPSWLRCRRSPSTWRASSTVVTGYSDARKAEIDSSPARAASR
jgi:hypothetical protein